MFYLLVISISAIIIATASFLADGILTVGAFALLLLQTVLGVAAVFLIDGICAFFARRLLPARWFAPEARLFAVSDREKRFYRRVKINTWKRFVPEWGCFTGFHKDRVRAPSDAEYIGRFLSESNYGVAGHLIGALVGFAIMALPFLRPFSMALPIAAVNAILNVLPTMILRSNTPGLRAMYRRNLRREARANDTEKT